MTTETTQHEAQGYDCKRCEDWGEVCCKCKHPYWDCPCPLDAEGEAPDRIDCPACAFREAN